MITIKDSREIELMRHAGHVVGLVHKELEKFLRPGLTTQEVADFCEKIRQNTRSKRLYVFFLLCYTESDIIRYIKFLQNL